MATHTEVLLAVLDSRLAHVHTAMPGKVESYDAATQTVSVKPQLKTAYPDGEGDYTHKDLPVIPNVPVAFPRAGGFFVSFPIQKGDFVLLVFSERSIQAWRDKGTAVEPGDLGLHPLDGAVAIPGVFPEADALDDAHASNMRLGKDGTAGAQIEITESEVRLGQGGDDPVVTKKDLQMLYAAINGAAPVANDGGAALKTAILTALGIAGWSSTTGITVLGSTVVKARRS
jgi:hypothetical protein